MTLARQWNNEITFINYFNSVTVTEYWTSNFDIQFSTFNLRQNVSTRTRKNDSKTNDINFGPGGWKLFTSVIIAVTDWPFVRQVKGIDYLTFSTYLFIINYISFKERMEYQLFVIMMRSGKTPMGCDEWWL